MNTRILLAAILLCISGLVGIIIVANPMAARADTTRYVKEGGTGDGTSWIAASGTLQAMINAVEIAGGGTVCVASGTYTPTTKVGGTGDRYQTFRMKNDVGIYGGFPNTGSPSWGDRNWETHRTVLSGEIGNPGTKTDNCYHVFYHPSGTKLDGTAILDGFTISAGYADGGTWLNDYGGGMFNCESSSPQVTNCNFSGNSADSYGGGMYNYQYSSPQVTNCNFSGNSADERGGGMYNSNSDPEVINCTFSGNSADERGGGMYNDNSYPHITNCILWGDTASSSGDEIYNNSFSSPAVTYCDVQGGYSGTGNISGNPMLVNPGSGDFHLLPTSPCIDFGSNAAIQATGVTEDFEGDARIQYAVVDMGADETPYDAPQVTTGIASDITSNSATLNGTLVEPGNAGTVTVSFIYGGSHGGPYPLETGTLTMTGTGSFNKSISNLINGKTYYFRAVAVGEGANWGSESQFTTISVPEIWYVNSGSGSVGDGSSWSQAFDNVQSALDIAYTGDEIWVASGTYTPSMKVGGTGDRYRAFQMKNGVKIYGGFPSGGSPSWVERDWQANETILSGEIGNSGTKTDNCYQIFYHPSGTNLDSTAILDGFIIAGGYADGDYHHDNGGGMSNESSSPEVTNCTFTGNSCVAGGGGMANYEYSSPIVTNCTFTGNSCASEGGGMANYEYSSPIVTNCTFTGNSADDIGGGMFNYSSDPEVTNCTFTSNSASHYGGGMSNLFWAPTVTNCTFTGNSCAADGGGMYNDFSDPKVTNCTFSGNSADKRGGGMANYYSNLEVTNCTFTENSADSYGGGMFNLFWEPTVTNCILWGNNALLMEDEIHNDSSSPVVTYCDVQVNPGSPVYPGTGNISADPLWVNPGSGDFHLQPDSPCINAGTNSAPAMPAADFEGDDRIIDGVADMGVDEYLAEGVEVKIIVTLQGTNRPSPAGWEVPLNIGFYLPNSPNSWLLNPGSAIYYFSGTATAEWINGGTKAVITVGPVNSGTYDITADSSTTLLNVKRSVHIP